MCGDRRRNPYEDYEEKYEIFISWTRTYCVMQYSAEDFTALGLTLESWVILGGTRSDCLCRRAGNKAIARRKNALSLMCSRNAFWLTDCDHQAYRQIVRGNFERSSQDKMDSYPSRATVVGMPTCLAFNIDLGDLRRISEDRT